MPAADPDTAVWHYDLDAVVVTGTRTPKLLKDTPIQTRLITSRDIARTDATNIQDLLQAELPGVEFSYAMNQQKHLNLAGFGGQSILFLVDGERLAGETMDDVDFGRLVMTDVERIEIVRGASSALYGRNAAGGVINIITRQAQKPWQLNLSTRYGKHDDQRHTAMWGVRRDTWHHLFTASYDAVDNYDVTNADAPRTRVIQTVYGNRTLNLRDRIGWQPHPNLDLTARLGYFRRQETRIVDLPDRYRDFAAGLRGDWRLSSSDHLQLRYNFDEYDKSEYQRNRHKEIRRYSNVQNTVGVLYTHDFATAPAAPQHTAAAAPASSARLLTVGASYMRDYLYNTYLAGAERAQDCADFFAQYDWQVCPEVEVVGAIRYDYFSVGDASQLTPKVNLRYTPIARLTLRAGYGMGFRAPTLKERFYDFNMNNIWVIEGNPNLQPEVSHNFTLGAEYARGEYNLTVSGYYNTVRDKIASAMPYYKTGVGVTDGMPYLPYINISDFRVYGAECSLRGHWSNGWSARLSYTYTCESVPHMDRDNGVFSQYMPARPHSVGFRVDYDHRFSSCYGISLGLSGRMLSGVRTKEYVNYYDITEGMVDIRYPAYSILKVSAVQHLWQGLKVTVAVDNILDYRPKYYYLNSPLTDGVTLQVGLSADLDQLF